MGAEEVLEPEVPVTVKLYCPTVAVLPAVRVNTEVPFDSEDGENEAVTPLGKAETERLTLPLNPY